MLPIATRLLLTRGGKGTCKSLFVYLPLALFASYCSSAARALSSSTTTPKPSLSGATKQRYLHVAARSATAAPPLLIIPGTAQSIELWEQHVPFLSRSRSVVICEPLGMGLHVPQNVDMSLQSQAETLQKTLKSINVDETISGPIDVAGFSLGGRIAMALACQHPNLIGRLHLTGVALHRSNWGTLQIDAWKNLLEHSDNDLRPFAWSALLASYSPDFLMGQRDKLPLWVDGLSSRHTVQGLRQVVRETHNDQDNDWSVVAMAMRLPSRVQGRLCVGEQDQMAPVSQVQALAKALDWSPPTVIPHAAHVPPIENPSAWRKDLESFLALGEK